MRYNKDGFSMIELLLVVVVLGILTTVVVLAVGGMTSDAEETGCLADRRSLEKATEAFFAQGPASTIPAAPVAEEPYEQTLVDWSILRETSVYYDLDGTGQIIDVVGSPCAA